MAAERAQASSARKRISFKDHRSSGIELTYTARNERGHCVGHKPFRDKSVDWFDCDSSPLTGMRKCDRCTANDATYASYLHHAHTRGAGELPASMQEQLNRENLLYVAGFRDGSVKIGTSNAARIETRLAEQGAWRARIVASTTDGFVVREVEDQVTSQFGIAQAVSVRRKLRGLITPVDDASLLSRISEMSALVHSLLSEYSVDRVTSRNDAWTSPVAEDPVWDRVIEYPTSLKEGSHTIDVQSVSGRVAAFQRPGIDDVFVADLGALTGVELEVTNAEPEPLTIQSSLF